MKDASSEMLAMETVDESIYDHPKYYDLVFGADCAAEIKFVLGCSKEFASPVARKRGNSASKNSASKNTASKNTASIGPVHPERMFEPACGTGRLLYALAKKGYDVAGLDLNPNAVEFCNARFRRHGLDEPAFVADMADFQVRRHYDIAFNTINSFRHLASEKAAKGHLQCMGEAVRTGGLYLLGIHLTPTEVAPSETESWSARRGHLSINTHMWTNSRDKKSRVERFGIRFDVHTPSRSFRIADELVLRSYTPAQMNRLIQSSGCWEVVATYDFAYDLDDPITVDATTEDVVYVLRRR